MNMRQLYMLNIVTEEATYIRPAPANERYYGSYKAKWSEKERLQIVFDTFEDVRDYLYAKFTDEWLNSYSQHHRLAVEEATIKDHMTRAIEDWRLNPDNLMPEVTMTFKTEYEKNGISHRIIINDESVTMIPYVPHTNEEE
jgi:hypothetical protein